MNSKNLDISDELVDEIVDEILAETESKPLDKIPQLDKSIKKTKPKEENVLDTDLPEFPKLKARLQSLENRIEKHVHDYKTTAVEVERQIVDKFSEFEQENEKRLIYLQGQLEALRDAMIRLSNEFKQSKESISSQK